MNEQHVRDLQLANEDCPIASPFSPARMNKADQIQKPSKCVPEDDVEIFEGVTYIQLRELYHERHEDNKWIESDYFAVLDGRGAETRTVVIHYYDTVFDEETEEEIGGRWVTWRVSFDEAWDMVTQLMTTPEIVERVYMNSKHLIGEDGVFPVRKAERQKGYRK